MKRSVNKVIVHENYGDLFILNNDIALIRVNEPIQLFSEDPGKSSVIPVCLPWKEDDPGRALREGDQLINTGWGRNNNNKQEGESILKKYHVSSKSLHSVEVPYVSHENKKCTSIESKQQQQDSIICAGGEIGKGNCQGDSGTPLLYRKFSGEPMYLVGLSSYGTSKCAVGKADVYTNIAYYLDWIESKLEP